MSCKSACVNCKQITMLTVLDFAWTAVAMGFTYVVAKQLIIAVIICAGIYILIKAFIPSHARSSLFRFKNIKHSRINEDYEMASNQLTNPSIKELGY